MQGIDKEFQDYFMKSVRDLLNRIQKESSNRGNSIKVTALRIVEVKTDVVRIFAKTNQGEFTGQLLEDNISGDMPETLKSWLFHFLNHDGRVKVILNKATNLEVEAVSKNSEKSLSFRINTSMRGFSIKIKNLPVNYL